MTDLIRAHEVNYCAEPRRSAAVPGPGRGGGREQNLMKLQPGIKNIVLMHLMDMWTWAGEQPSKKSFDTRKLISSAYLKQILFPSSMYIK